MADRVENKAAGEAPETTSNSLIHGVMDHLKQNYKTASDSSATISERAAAGAQLLAEGAVAGAAAYGLTKFGLGRILGGKSVAGELSATERLVASSTPINSATRELASESSLTKNMWQRYFESDGFKARLADPSIDKMILQPHEVAHDLSMIPKVNRLE